MLIPFKELNIYTPGVLHIGGHWGEEAKDYYSSGVKRSVWVEANPECLETLNYELSKYSDYKIFTECLTDKDGQNLQFNISNNEGQSSSILDFSYHSIAHPEVSFINHIEVKTKRLDTLFKENNLSIEDYSFINLDIQGAELLALKGFGELLSKVKFIYIEVNDKELYKDCPLTQEIINYLEPFGFRLRQKVMAGNFGWGDAFFVNKNLI